MNPGQLWVTTLDPNVRTLLQVQIKDSDDHNRKRCSVRTFRQQGGHEIAHGLMSVREFLHGRSNGASHKWREAASQSAVAR